jgi:hypothetical protein
MDKYQPGLYQVVLIVAQEDLKAVLMVLGAAQEVLVVAQEVLGVWMMDRPRGQVV